MVHIVSDSDALDFKHGEMLPGTSLDNSYEQECSKPFRGILIGLAIVTPLWLLIGVALYFLI